MFENETRPEQALLVALDTGEYDAQASLDELAELTRTAGAEPAFFLTQKRPAPDTATCLGSGMAEEAADLVKREELDLAIFDRELSPTQIRNLEELFGVRVIDRTTLILDIFAQRARSREGKLQVELAQLRYLLPRLSGQGTALSRLGGGIGTRGPGETKLETDRRHIRRRISGLKAQLEEVEAGRELIQRRRQKAGTVTVALVGYTNAGKSTLMNQLTQAGVLAEDKLFATLDPTARKLTLPSGLNVIAVDTVGFVSRLPHKLVEAFKSTLEEAAYSDVIVKVADAADSEREAQLEVTDQVLAELGCGGIPQITVYNKCDKAGAVPFQPGVLLTSARTGRGLDALLQKLDEALSDRVRAVKMLLPYDKLSLAEAMRSRGSVTVEDYREDGVWFEGFVKSTDLHLYLPYLEQ